jgi:aspartate carbamoyltransferase catalytic subunit
VVSKELRANPNVASLVPPDGADTLHPEPETLIESKHVRLDLLRGLAGRSIVSVSDVSRGEVVELCRLAALLESIEVAPYQPLAGKLVLTAFFEASTRTRLSFESAVLRLDGRVISIPDGQLTGVKKGESLEDIGEMFNAYGDLVVMRHTDTDSVARLQENLRLPLVNAGNGSGEHPTQALADWYALSKWRPSLTRQDAEPGPGLNIGILGTPGSMRAVKSFLMMALLFQDHVERITVVSEMADPFGQDLRGPIDDAGISCNVTHDMRRHLPELDVIYMNSIAFLGDSYRTLDARYKLNADSPIKPDAVVLHPLARLDELDTSLDQTSHNLYWSQAHGAVFVRQAMLMAILDRLDRLPAGAPVV